MYLEISKKKINGLASYREIDVVFIIIVLFDLLIIIFLSLLMFLLSIKKPIQLKDNFARMDLGRVIDSSRFNVVYIIILNLMISFMLFELLFI